MNHSTYNRTPQVGRIPQNCPHCKKEAHRGTHGGCKECGRVTSTKNGRRAEVRAKV